MEYVQDPNSIEIAENLKLLLSDIDAETKAFRDLGDFPPEVKAELQKAFLPERISDTLNIEGIKVNPRITRAVLEGLTLADADRYSEREILNVIAANDLIENEARQGSSMDLAFILELHRLVELDLIPSAGSLREQDVVITGAERNPPSWPDLRDLLGELAGTYGEASSLHPAVRAAWLHATFTAIHPFMDGNGRTGRLLQDFSLLTAGLLPVGIPVSRRAEYYDALEAADSGDWRLLIEVIGNSQLTALDRARRIAAAPVERRSRISKLLKVAQNTVKQTDYNRYEVWRRRIEGVRDEFVRWAEDLDAEADTLGIRVRTYDPISFDKWREVSAQGRSSGTWLLSMTFTVSRRPVYTFLFYARRHEFSYVDDTDQVERGRVGVFLTGANEPDAKFEFAHFDDPYVALRELLFVEGELRTYRDPSVRQDQELPTGVAVTVDSGRWTSDELALPDIVEEFFTDALCKLGLIQ